MTRFIYVNVQSIHYSSQDSKEVKKNCAHEIIHLNNMHGTKHTPEYV